ncbi:hypothetical protein K438DRAFT_1986216 [Mycena galopus ATCC 62051]|nr:hypothetical protein K438DRAFT_1986216 [Mycena galopus ATCC 62051]
MSPSSASRANAPVACIQSLTTPATETSSSIAVACYNKEYANQVDLQTFLERFRTHMNSSTSFTLQIFDGGSNSQNSSEADLEANLDTRYTVGVATRVPISLVSGGRNFEERDLHGPSILPIPFLGKAMFPMSRPPHKLKTRLSYRGPLQLCQAYAALGARGTSVLYASGDGGVEGSQPQTCTTYQPAFLRAAPTSLLLVLLHPRPLPPSRKEASLATSLVFFISTPACLINFPP